jgi:beta-lactamase regulating signal transducer with metallopeptidase domain
MSGVTEIQQASDLLVNATLNGVYQGVILAALVGITLRMIPRTNAATRHAVWFFALLLIVAIIPAHLFYDLISRSRGASQIDSPAIEIAAGAGGLAAAVSLADASDQSYMPLAKLPTLVPENSADLPPADTAIGTLLVSTDPSLPGPRETEQIRASSFLEQLRSWQSLIPSAPTIPISWNFLPGSRAQRQAATVLLCIWATVACVRLIVLTRRVLQIRELKGASVSPGKELEDLFNKLCVEAGLSRAVSLKVVKSQRSAALLGFLHPAVVLPVENRGIAGETDQILRHELAHARRRDDWANLFQQIIQAAFFFHPAVWWISKQVSLEREIACDDCVLQHAGHRRSYALLLANLADRMRRPALALAPGVSTRRSQLQQRINMILNTDRNTSPRLAKSRLGIVASIAALLAVLILYVAPRIALAVPPPALAHIAQPADQPSQDVKVSRPGSTEAGDATAPAEPVTVEVAAVPQTPFAPAAPVAIDPGPKFKGEPGETTPRPSIAPVPAAPALPPSLSTPALPPVGAALALPPVAALTPMPAPTLFPFDDDRPDAPRRPRSADGPDKDASIEERLARVEKMVRSLMAERRGGQPGHMEWRDGDMAKIITDKEVARIKEQAIRDATRASEEARRDAERAGEEARRAVREIQRTFGEKMKREMEENYKLDAQNLERHHESIAQQMEALKRQREVLQRQMEKLQNQLERLEKQHEKMKDKKERDEEPDPKDAPSPPKK